MSAFRPRRASAGASLRSRLLLILIVPLLGAGLVTMIQASVQLTLNRSAARVQAAARDLAAVDAVRRDIGNEIEPAGRAEVLRTGRSKHLSGFSGDDVQTVAAQAQADLTRARSATEKSFQVLSASLSEHWIAATVSKIHGQVQQARLGFAPGGPLAASYQRWLAVLDDVANLETSLIESTPGVGLTNQVSASLEDLRVVTEAAGLAGQVVGRYTVSTLIEDSDIPAARAEFLTIWGTYQTAAARVAHTTATPLRQAWTAATSSADAVRLDEAILNGVPRSQPVSLIELAALGSLSSARQMRLNAVVALSVERAIDAAGSARASAQHRLAIILGTDVLLLLTSISIALIGRRWIARSLDRLAEQAGRLSEGDLVDIEITGPRECRTVAQAMSAMVTTLRRLEHQASAVAEGRLDAAVLKTPVPGPLGQLVHGSITRLVEAVQDRELAQQALAYQAAHDGLTNLPNRAHAVQLIEKSLHRAQRTGAMTGLMFVDLDHFKAVNDSFGHAAGDHVLQEVARRMRDVVREGDVVSRLGGDEFVILLEALTAESDFARVANRLVSALDQPISFGERQLRVGASIGIAVCRDSHVDGSRLMREADAAVYRAKAAGRGRVDVFDDALREQLSSRADLEAAISAGLTRNEFLVHYQPVVDLLTGAAVGVEALIRWDRPGIGLVAPDDFIPIAESSNLINDIGRFVLKEATMQLAAWTTEDPTTAELTMAVNLSGRHLSSHQVVQDVTDVLRSSGVEARRLVIELTETMVVDDPRATANMQTLRALGVRVAIDDFGTGYTSIGHLPRLPVDTLKIDRSFISSLEPSHHELVRLMVAAARAFGLSIVAEGVETENQAALLRSLSVESCQGFLYARPQPASSLNPAALMRGQAVPDGALGRLAPSSTKS